MPERRYCAFISYRHADNSQDGRRWAEWLHRALERYSVPPDLVGTPNLRGEAIPRSLYPIFRDEDELPAHADLATGIRSALEVSEHLIVLCSPRSAVSPWVRREVREFKELGRTDRILAVMLAGEPNVDDPVKIRSGMLPEEECFCEELRYGLKTEAGKIDWTARTEPLAADLRPGGLRAEGFVNADAYREHLTLHSSLPPEKVTAHTEAYRVRLELGLLKVVAGLLGVPLSQLTERDAAYRAELARQELARSEAEAARLRAVNRRVSVAAGIAFILTIVAGWFWGRATEETKKAESATAAAVKLNQEAARSDRLTAEEKLRAGDRQAALAYLARSCEYDRKSKLAAEKAIALLGDWPFPAPVRLLGGHTAGLNQVRFDHKGRQIVTASADKTARVWDAQSGALLATLSGHEEAVTSAEFSADDAQILTISQDKTVRLWEAKTGKLLSTLAHPHPVKSAQLSPDKTTILTAAWDPTARLNAEFTDAPRSGDKTVRVWDASSGQLRSTLTGHEDSVLSIQYSPDGARIITGSWDKTARVWETASGRVLHTLPGHGGMVAAARFSRDGSRLLTLSTDAVRVWDGAGTLLATLKAHGLGVFDAQFDEEGKRVVTASADKTACLWDIATGKVLVTLSGHQSLVWHAGFSADGSRVVTASGDGTARVWESSTGRVLATLIGHEGPLAGADFSADGTLLVTCSSDRMARVWSTRFVTSPAIPAGTVEWGESFSPDGSRLVTSSFLEGSSVWEVKSGRLLFNLTGQGSGIWRAQFSPDGSRIVTASQDKLVKIWDAADGKLLATLPGHESIVWDARYSPDGSRIVTASGDKTARVWDAATSRTLVTLTGHEGFVRRAQFSPDGQKIVTSSSDKTARVWEAATGKPLVTLRGHASRLVSARFSPDGSRIVTTSEDGTSRVWNAITGESLVTLIGHTGIVEDARFNADGSRVATVSQDRTVKLWDANTGKFLATLPGYMGSGVFFSKDSSRLVTHTPGHTLQAWALLPLHAGVPPEWFPDFLRWLAQKRLNADGELVGVSAEEWVTMRETLHLEVAVEVGEQSPYLEVARTYFGLSK